MTRWAVFIPVAALTFFVGYLALRMGALPSETQIINRYADRYVQTVGEGAELTDCAATAHPSARMIIVCHHDSRGTFSYVVDDRGRLISNQGPSA